MRRTRGYTFVELLVASIAAILLGLGVTAGVLGFSQRSARENSIGLLQTNLRRALLFANRDLQSALYVLAPDSLAGRVPSISDVDGEVPVLAFWRRPSAPGVVNPPFEKVIYYLMSPPAGSSLFGPQVITRAVLQFPATGANSPDTSGDGVLDDAEALTTLGAANALTVANTQALVDRIDDRVNDPGFTINVVNNRTVVLNITGDADLLAGLQSKDGNRSLATDDDLRRQLRQQIVVSLRNR
jgi:Tfp pilus assembly protein PilW